MGIYRLKMNFCVIDLHNISNLATKHSLPPLRDSKITAIPKV